MIVILFLLFKGKKENNTVSSSKRLSAYRIPLNVGDAEISDYKSLTKLVDDESNYLKSELSETEATAMSMFRLLDQRGEEVTKIPDFMSSLEQDYPTAFPMFSAFFQYKRGYALSKDSRKYLGNCRRHKFELLDDYYTGFLASSWESFGDTMNQEGVVFKSLAKKIMMFLDYFNAGEIEAELSPSLKLNTAIAALRFLNYENEDEISTILNELTPIYAEKDSKYYMDLFSSSRES